MAWSAALVSVFWLGALVWATVVLGPTRPNEIGDSLNVLGSLFNGLALAAIAGSLIFQRMDFQATLDETQEGQELQRELLEVQRQQSRLDRLRTRVSCLEWEAELLRHNLENGTTMSQAAQKEHTERLELLRAEHRAIARLILTAEISQEISDELSAE